MYGILIGDGMYDNPRTSIGRSNGLHRIATLLRKNDITIEVLDFFNDWSNEELTLIASLNKKVDFVAVSNSLNILNPNKVDIFTSILRHTNKDLRLIVGGTNALLCKFKNVDIYFQGYAEAAIPSVVKYLTYNDRKALPIRRMVTHDIKDVVYCNDDYPLISMDNLENIYTEGDFIDPTETLTIEFSRGCIFSCAFCSFPLIGKKNGDYIRSEENIKEEFIRNYRDFGTTRYLITDDTFNDSEVKVNSLYNIAKKLPFKLTLMGYTRIDLLHAKSHTLARLIESGFIGFQIGIETYNEKSSKLIGKSFSGDRLKNYLLDIRQLYPDLHISSGFICGLPGETMEEFISNITWSVDNRIINAVFGTALYIPRDNSINHISKFSKDWEKYGYSEMNRSEIDEFLKNTPHKIRINLNHYISHYIPWKNEYMNFLEAEICVNNLREIIKDKVSINGWWAMAQTIKHLSISTSINTPVKKYDWDTQKKLALDFVEDYKRKKIRYLQNSINKRLTL